MRETQHSISQWAIDTFGESGTDIQVLVRANEECAELLHALSHDDFGGAAEECADVAIVLARFAERQGFNILQPVAGACGRGSAFTMALQTSKEIASLGMYVIGDNPDQRHHIVYRSLRIIMLLRRIANLLSPRKTWRLSPFARMLDVEIDRKMEINRQRKWPPKYQGTGSYHIQEELHA